MAFSFGAAPTPAPSGGGFSFGSSSNTPAPSFAFGASGSSTTSFGSTPAPATAFGSAPAPTSLFGSSAATSFGSTPAPAFGSTPAPAFGAAPSGGLGSGGALFGSTPSTAPAPFGSLQPAAQQPTPLIKGSTLYADLSPQYKAAIDKIYNSMMEHKRTLLQVQSTGPAALQVPSSHNAQPTMQETPKSQLQLQVEQVTKELNRLQQELAQTNVFAVKQKSTAEENAAAAYTFAKWPLEANAVRHGISLSTTRTIANEEKKDGEVTANANQNEDTDISIRLGELLDQATLHVDRIERMPSPYFWQCLDDFQRRILDLQDQLSLARHQIDHIRTRPSGSAIHVAVVVEEQHRAIWSMGDRLARLNSAVNEIRHKYQLYERPGQNVLEKARKEEIDRQQRVNERLRRAYLQSAQTPAPATASSSAAPAPATSSFGFSSTAPAPSAFSASTTTTASAPSTSGTTAFSFSGSTPAPTASGPSPAPALFAGATSSTFGASNATAPAPSGLGFASPAGITPATPKKKSTSASRRLNRR
ncbi:hypothetical protein FisN_1Lh108 [Fistulifera solaris]|uniref:Nucleoporin Nup54 alpha-helical domain-containing protein n=1 Tax=Fistulifera solaris TaxID=1519565 RepID=A0A1Z5K5N0_FISSO|nr:hypothetical protein FisN_1Lh108 [Fistulifera solaris]|eukprot:GAX21278.1 hypothetical protein FisN_1Lh108 [Fistulifera solaris]